MRNILDINIKKIPYVLGYANEANTSNNITLKIQTNGVVDPYLKITLQDNSTIDTEVLEIINDEVIYELPINYCYSKGNIVLRLYGESFYSRDITLNVSESLNVNDNIIVKIINDNFIIKKMSTSNVLIVDDVVCKNLFDGANPVITNEDGGARIKTLPVDLFAGIYTLSVGNIESTNTNSYLINLYNSNNAVIKSIHLSSGNSSSTFTITEAAKRIRFYSSDNYENTSGIIAKYYDVQIERGTKATDYVPFKEFGYNSIDSMRKIVVDDINCRNLLDVPSLFIINHYFTRTNLNLPAGTYTISASEIKTTGTEKEVLFECFGLSGKIYYHRLNIDEKKITFTSTEDYIYTNVYSQSNWNNSQGITTTITNLQLEKGDKSTSYTTFKKYGYNSTESMGEIVADEISSKNMLNISGVGNSPYGSYDSSTNKITLSSNHTQTTFLNGTENLILKAGQPYTVTIYLDNLSTTTTTDLLMRFDNQSGEIAKSVYFDVDTGSSIKSNTFILDTDLEVRRVGFYLPNAGITFKIQLEKGSKSTSYAPYKGFSCSYGSIDDLFFYKTGETQYIDTLYNAAGHLTGNSKDIHFTIIVPKLMNNITNVNIDMFDLTIRSATGGYLMQRATTIDGTIKAYKGSGNHVRVSMSFNTAFSVTNNTPVSVVINEMQLSFS